MDEFYRMGCASKRHYHYHDKHAAKRAAQLSGDHVAHGCFVRWCPICKAGWIVASRDDRVGRRGGRS